MQCLKNKIVEYNCHKLSMKITDPVMQVRENITSY